MKTKAAILSLCALAVVAPRLEARENSLSGGGSITYEMYDKSGGESAENTGGEVEEAAAPQAALSSDDDDDYSRIIISPVLTIKSIGDKNAVSLSYSPVLQYGDDSDGDIQQVVSITADWSPTSRWALSFRDSYQETDTDLDNVNMAGFTPQPATVQGGQGRGSGQSEQGASVSQSSSDSQLTDSPGRQKYSTNDFEIAATYTYWEDSSLKFGYGLEQLRYDNLIGSNQDYDKNTIFANIKHRLNSQYSLAAEARYAMGTFDDAAPIPVTDAVAPLAEGDAALSQPDDNSYSPAASSDVDELHFSTSLESLVIPHHPLSLTYTLDTSKYDDEGQGDTQIHALLFGWTWEMSEKSTFTFSIGPSYQKNDGDEGDSWDYALNAAYSRRWSAAGDIVFSAAHGAEMRNFSGNANDNGMTEYWRGGVNINQALSQNLALNLMATAADEDVSQSASITERELEDDLAAGGASNTRQYTLGGGLSYNFARWYALGLNYSYTTQDGDLPEDNYDEHRLMLVLSMQRDFFHW
ncbi:MAG: outer membrane beta-barrel protein [Desulfobulbaceae bacterium]|jgi:hypothetical protein|nr:outer membrane beta-barrel protein [Desulfobulbaceae bacterium]